MQARQDSSQALLPQTSLCAPEKIADRPEATASLVAGWETVIGLEIHAQIDSQSKLFSAASVDSAADPNSRVSFVDAGFPGMLPVLNEYCLAQAVRTGLGLGAEINLWSRFDRKNYFYPDLPNGYQISQYAHPIVGEGVLVFDQESAPPKSVRIERLHLEQDAGKLVHDLGRDTSHVDLNRAGVALMEIVTKPDMFSAEEAAGFLRELRRILRYLGSSRADMEKGQLRADVNISVRQPGAPLGTRCEIKNVNSIRVLQMAIRYETTRQIKILEQGGKIAQQTRLFDPPTGQTRAMRTKEQAHDYRYFPDPDLPPVQLSRAWVEEIKAGLPELPRPKKARFCKQYAISEYEAAILTDDREAGAYYEIVAQICGDGKLAASWVSNELFARLNKENCAIGDNPVTAAQLGELCQLIAKGVISGKIAKDLFAILWQEGGAPAEIVEKRKMGQISDHTALSAAISEILSAHEERAHQYRDGKEKLFGWFMGQIMQKTRGKANPETMRDLLYKKLNENE